MRQNNKSKSEVESTERFCKKCGEPLRSTNKYKFCENCRRTNTNTLGKGLITLGLVLIPCVKHFTGKK